VSLLNDTLLNVTLLYVSLVSVTLINVILLNVAPESVTLLNVILPLVVLLKVILLSVKFKTSGWISKKVILRSATPHFNIYDVRFWVLASPLFAYRRHIELLFSEMRFNKQTGRENRKTDRQKDRKAGWPYFSFHRWYV
jgi:hypothetical protein